MKKIKVIGIGMGDEMSMTVAAKDWLMECDLLIGASRMVKTATAIAGMDEKECIFAWQPKEVWSAICRSQAEKIAVLMSGDIGFFSGARALREEVEAHHKEDDSCAPGLCEFESIRVSESESICASGSENICTGEFAPGRTDMNATDNDARACKYEKNRAHGLSPGKLDDDACEYEFSWLPGISSMAYFCNAIGISYEDVYALSIHGRSGPYIRQIAIHEKTFLLTDGDLPGLSRKLVDYALENVTVWVGMNLTLPQQKIFKTTPEELTRFPKENCCPLTVCLILNPDAERWRNPYCLDGEFCRDGKVPMTKEEVRGIILGKLRPGSRDVIYDIGGGTGSVSVACAIAASGGTVYSVECDADALKLMDENRHRFACDNMEIIAGHAPEALRGLPAPDRVFIGGSGGKLDEILAELEKRLKCSKKSARGFDGPSEEDQKTCGESDRISGEMKKVCGVSGEEKIIPAGSGNLAECRERKVIRVVISSITLETNATVSSYIHTSDCVQNAEVCQVAVSKSKKIGGSTLMIGQNPVTVFSFDLIAVSY